MATTTMLPKRHTPQKEQCSSHITVYFDTHEL